MLFMLGLYVDQLFNLFFLYTTKKKFPLDICNQKYAASWIFIDNELQN